MALVLSKIPVRFLSKKIEPSGRSKEKTGQLAAREVVPARVPTGEGVYQSGNSVSNRVLPASPLQKTPISTAARRDIHRNGPALTYAPH